MAHILTGIVSSIPTPILHALVLIIGTLSALCLCNLLLVKSAKAVFANRGRHTRVQ